MFRANRGALTAVVLFLLVNGSVRAQQVQPLSFPNQPVESANDLQVGMAFGKPLGVGPFPAVILLQTCSGATADQRDWGRRAMLHGYVALVVDSMGPRFIGSQDCRNLPIFSRVDDALRARTHLAQFAFVDKNRIGLVGFSAGASAAGIIGDSANSARGGFMPFRAIVAFYPGCVRRPEGGDFVKIYQNTIRNAPTLFLFGDNDTQARVAECVPQFENLKGSGADVDWIVYPGATHCFDCRSEDGKRAYDTLHNTAMPFRYDSKATADAEQRVFSFFAEKMRPEK